ncbi:MAG: hypothetical protein NVSMB6_11490 [Burkholderiaceae bacterium]
MRRPFFQNALVIPIVFLGLGVLGTVLAAEPVTDHHHHAAAGSVPMPFVASRDKPYGALVDDAMAIMSNGMAKAPMNGDVDHDFASMMVPHHQGAVDMAKSELLYGTNPVLRRLAQEIIVTQGQEIQVMQLELKKLKAATPVKP